MTLRCEEMQSTGRYARVTAYVSVFCCDHRDELDRRCWRARLIGLGMGDSVTDEEIADAEANGWIIGDRDYCPDHADEHRDNEETDEVET